MSRVDRAFQPNGCLDIDECFERSHNCHSYAACHNQRGTFYCECNTGFEGDGENCEDIDECSKAGFQIQITKLYWSIILKLFSIVISNPTQQRHLWQQLLGRLLRKGFDSLVR